MVGQVGLEPTTLRLSDANTRYKLAALTTELLSLIFCNSLAILMFSLYPAKLPFLNSLLASQTCLLIQEDKIIIKLNLCSPTLHPHRLFLIQSKLLHHNLKACVGYKQLSPPLRRP